MRPNEATPAMDARQADTAAPWVGAGGRIPACQRIISDCEKKSVKKEAFATLISVSVYFIETVRQAGGFHPLTLLYSMTKAMAAEDVRRAATAKYLINLRILPIPSVVSAVPSCICSIVLQPNSPVSAYVELK